MKKYIVTGCAGFIGSNLVDRLLSDGFDVIGIDNYSTGQSRFIEKALLNPNFHFIELDILDLENLKKSFAGGDFVFHLSANADVRHGLDNRRKDLEQNTIATYNVLEAMRANNIYNIAFSSTGSVYGEASVIPTPEDAPFPIQTSLYGSSKCSCEGLMTSYSEGFDFNVWIFRFVSILGERYTHGHVYDFYHKLIKDPKNLLVLGNGKQKKSYLYVGDCINAMLMGTAINDNKINIYNLGINGYCELIESINWICDEMGVNPNIEYTGGERGWVGDNPFIFLDTSKIESIGWKPANSISQGVVKTVQYLRANEWVFDKRD